MTPKSLLHPARLARRPVVATQTDSRLVDLVRAGYEPAFEAIVERYRRPLLRYVGTILPQERCEDVVQLAFINAYEAVRRDTRELDLRPWLYRIAHNAAVNALRDRALHHAELRDDWDGVERPDQAVERSEGLRKLLAAVGSLPSRQRDAIVLRELEGRSYEEIAGALGVSGGAVRQLLNRARNTLRAAATAIVPVGLVTRMPWTASAEPLHARTAEALGAAGAGAVAAKVCAAALVTGAVVGGVALAPRSADNPSPAAAAAERAEQPGASARTEDDGVPALSRATGARAGSDDGAGGREDRHGTRGRYADDDGDDREGRGDGDDDHEDDDSNSGPGAGGEGEGGSGDDDPDSTGDSGPSDSSGSGSGGSLSSGTGSGDDDVLSSSGSGSSFGSGSSSGSGAISGSGSSYGSGAISGSASGLDDGSGSGSSGSQDAGSLTSGSGELDTSD